MNALEHPFKVRVEKREDGNNTEIELAPALSRYRAILQYDDRGNATVTILDRDTERVFLDMSLDSGEVFDYSDDIANW